MNYPLLSNFKFVDSILNHNHYKTYYYGLKQLKEILYIHHMAKAIFIIPEKYVYYFLYYYYSKKTLEILIKIISRDLNRKIGFTNL